MINLLDSYREIQTEAMEVTHKWMCQFLIEKEDETMTWASGAFIKVGNLQFLITATHVLDGFENKIFVPKVENDSIR
jgi:hypothetical protein